MRCRFGGISFEWLNEMRNNGLANIRRTGKMQMTLIAIHL